MAIFKRMLRRSILAGAATIMVASAARAAGGKRACDKAALDKNRDLAVSFVRGMKDHDGLDERLITDDFKWWAIGRGTVDTATFKKTFAARIAQRRALMPDLPDMQIVSTTAEDDRVAVECYGHCVLADGRPYNNNYVFLVYIRDGRVRMMREFGDSKYFYDILHGNPVEATPP
jgi:ketosteroid isomerase-like protein